MRLSTYFTLLLWLIVLFVNCSISNLAGDTSQTGNTYITGFVSLPSGQPAPNTQVMLLPRTYNPSADGPVSDAFIDTTDDKGEYLFVIKYRGEFSIQGVHIDRRTRLLVNDVVAQSDTTFVPNAILQNPGSIKVFLNSSMDTTFGYLYIPGTTQSIQLANSGDFAILDSVPASLNINVSYNTLNSTVPSLIVGDSITVPSGSLVTVAYYEWKHIKRLVLNTTSSGANVAGNVADFPVLIRLTQSNFEFSEALPDGGDIRFAAANGSPLSYEIERWDAALQIAEIWVKIDTVYGDDSTQYLTMYWGNASVSSVSLSEAVFDTAKGFGAVWHLAGNGDDATAGEHTGTVYGTSDSVGVIGGAKKFYGQDSIVVPGLFNDPQTMTLSAWAQLDTVIVTGSEVISLGDNALLRMDDLVNGTEAGMHIGGTTDSTAVFNRIASHQFFARTGWHFLSATYDGIAKVQILYIDGVEAGRLAENITLEYQGLGANTCIGTHGNGNLTYEFVGMIDEVRVCKTARSADWVKLSFMNQKAEDALVVFK
jgi:hypothetical protein